MNVTTAIRVKISPNVYKHFKHFICHSATVFSLHIVETLECYSNEKVEKDEAYNENVGYEEEMGCWITTSKSLEIVIRILFVSWVFNAIKVN